MLVKSINQNDDSMIKVSNYHSSSPNTFLGTTYFFSINFLLSNFPFLTTFLMMGER